MIQFQLSVTVFRFLTKTIDFCHQRFTNLRIQNRKEILEGTTRGQRIEQTQGREMGRKMELKFVSRSQDLGPRYCNFSRRSSKRGTFSIWILSSRINARRSFFRKFAASRRESPLSRQTHSSSPLRSKRAIPRSSLTNYNVSLSLFFFFVQSSNRSNVDRSLTENLQRNEKRREIEMCVQAGIRKSRSTYVKRQVFGAKEGKK